MQNRYSMFGEDYETRDSALPELFAQGLKHPTMSASQRQSTEHEMEEAWACQRFPLLENHYVEQRKLREGIPYSRLPRHPDTTTAISCDYAHEEDLQSHYGNRRIHNFMPAGHEEAQAFWETVSNPVRRTTLQTTTPEYPTAFPVRTKAANESRGGKQAHHDTDVTRLLQATANKRATGDHEASDKAEADFFEQSSGKRVCTEAVIVKALREQYPDNLITTVPARSCNLLAYAAAGHASASPMSNMDDANSVHKAAGTIPGMNQHTYVPPLRRLHGETGAVLEQVTFGRYKYQWKGSVFIVYFVDGGDSFRGIVPLQYIVGGTKEGVNALILEAGIWANDLHGEIWVFDGGFWRKDAQMWQSVSKASWNNVILEDSKKKAIQDDVLRFFRAEERYKSLGVPWKRGVIYYGPPGNGKTISIKAVLNQLSRMDRPVSIASLYVRSLASYAGPEHAVSQIFTKARQSAPCILVFEDLDSLITPAVRSYFLNEVDGLQANDGIFMIGSTNHLDKLDPAFKSRPSRFDRKFEFKDPDAGERVLYCEFWRNKILKGDGGVEFPRALCDKIAGITAGFSFAYLQEAFVGALLAIAAEDEDENEKEEGLCRTQSEEEFELVNDAVEEKRMEAGGGDEGDDKDLEKLVLWKAIKKQVEILKKEL